MISANEQIKAILELIQHKIDVSVPTKVLSITQAEIEHLPDHASLMDKLDWELSAINLYSSPNKKNLDDASLDLFEIEQSKRVYEEYMSYMFSIGEKYAIVYSQYIELNQKGVRIITPDDINLTIDSYNKSTGKLTLGTYHEVEIAQRGKSATTMDTKTAQCKLMNLLFKNDTNLKSGITLNYYFKISGVKEIDAKKVKQVKNLQTEINDKFREVTNLKKLVVMSKDRIKIDDSYLLKN